MQNKIPVCVIVGPTASGKTSLGVKVAKYLSGEVVSADSMQIYKNMPIASAAPTVEETEGIPHYLVGFAEADCKFSVAQYVKKATEVITDINNRQKTPVIVGGTGLYIDSLLEGLTFFDEDSSEIRCKLEQEAEEKGIESLFKKLSDIDPEMAAKLHLNDRKRIIRALEIFYLHGKTPSEMNRLSRQQESVFLPLFIGVTYKDREKLYEVINKRVDRMLENGLLDEAQKAYRNGSGKTAVQAIGHKEFFPFFEGKISLEEAVEGLKKATRNYAKRQLTWFRKNQDINWIYVDETDDVFENAKEILKDFRQ